MELDSIAQSTDLKGKQLGCHLVVLETLLCGSLILQQTEM